MTAKTPSPITVTAEPLARAADRLLIPASVGVPPRPPSDVVWSFEGEALGLPWRVRAIGPVGASKDAVQALIDDTLEAAGAVFDRARPGSEINRFNAAPTGFWALSDALWGLLDATMDMGDETDGAVDPTLGALFDLWADGQATPSVEALEASRVHAGWQAFRLNRPAQAALQPGGLTLDVSPVLAGHLVDGLGDRLAQAGATAHSVRIGGVMHGSGVRPDGQPWWARVEASDAGGQPPLVAALLDLAVAAVDRSAGDRAIDGREGEPVAHALVTVSVIDRSAFRAQALAHALTVMGPFEGPAYAEALGIAAHFVEDTARGPQERLSPALSAMLDDAVAGSA